MTLIRSTSGLLKINRASYPWRSYGNRELLFGDTYQDYATIYQTQPAVRTVVDFLARNIAHLGMKTYRRIDNTDREELPDHGLMETIKRANPWTNRYRLLRDLVSDLSIYDDAYWLKFVQQSSVPDAENPVMLVRLPPQNVIPSGENWTHATDYIFRGTKGELEFSADTVIHFRGYNPSDPTRGLSPLETLRRILAEEAASSEHRENYWKNAARMDGVLERPEDAPEWSREARKRFREEWTSSYAGGMNAGKVVVLEEGMTFKPMAFNAKESAFIESRLLQDVEVARAYHVPPPMVGILENATFSNIQEQHRNLYQDTLGPTLTMIQEEIELQLLPDFEDTDRVYVEFNLAEKLRGSFEEQATILQTATGAPYLSRNEARARQNLPRIDDPLFDIPVMPLNVLEGGQASPTDSAPDPEDAAEGGRAARGPSQAKAIPGETARLRDQYAKKGEEVLRKYFKRQARSVGSKAKASANKAAIFDLNRWNRELTADLMRLSLATASAAGQRSAARFGGAYDEDRTLNYIHESSRIAAEEINASTAADLTTADDDAVAGIFETAATSRAAQIGLTRATSMTNFGEKEGAEQSGIKRKVWFVTSSNSRHPEMDGESAPIGEPFSNGGAWPGDPSLGVDQVAGCTCLLDFE